MSNIKDFIGIWDNFMSDGFCDKVIDYYEEMEKHSLTFKRDQDAKLVEDSSINVLDNLTQYYSYGQTFIDEFYRKFWEVAYSEYYKKHQVLKNYPKHRSFHFKLQKTLPTEGYHVWHSEDDEMIVRRRLLFFILYLNDIEEGGETEFLYFKRRVKPQQGRLLLAPCGFTHYHRGNPPLSGDKYILTSWVEIS